MPLGLACAACRHAEQPAICDFGKPVTPDQLETERAVCANVNSNRARAVEDYDIIPPKVGGSWVARWVD